MLSSSELIPIVPRRRKMAHDQRERLTPGIRRALLILFDDQKLLRQRNRLRRGQHEHHHWIGSSDRAVQFVTIQAMYARYLIKIVVESRHQRQHTAVLTEIGQRVAHDISREQENGFQQIEMSSPTSPVCEETAHFITSVIE